MTLDIADYKTESWGISKSVSDALWVLSAKIDKHGVPAFFEQILATTRDHNNIPHICFVGIIPSSDLMLATAADKATVAGYDQGWYLTVQYVPADERTTLEDTNPAETISSLLGGAAWATVAGIEPHRINTVADWTNIKKSFEFGDRCTRWQAIQEICEYCNFVFVMKWRDVAGTWQPSAYFVHEDDIDNSTIGLDIPATVTITEPDPHLLSGVVVRDSPEHRYNRVLATGYDSATDTYYYATAQTAGVSEDTEIPIEYAYADASLNTQAKTDIRAQELLDFFQASAKVYFAKLAQRMDLELYQKIRFSGYNNIESGDMRITRITYNKAAYSDTVEIEFSKDQAIQQLRRLDRAVNPDHVSGSQDLITSDLADIGLIDAFDMPLASGTAVDDLWTTADAYVQLSAAAPLNLQGWSLDGVGGVRGSEGQDISFWGYDTANEMSVEFARWKNLATGACISSYLEIERELYINNGSFLHKIYFDIDAFRPIYIQGHSGTTSQSFEIVVGNDTMMRFSNYVGSTQDFVGCYANLLLTKDLIVDGAIMGDGNDDLVFEVAAGASIKFITK